MFQKYITKMNNMCKPARFYFILSVIGFILIALQNLFGESDTLMVGCASCSVPNKMIVLIANIIYILFWTYILNLICKDGNTTLSWLLVLLPYILFFVLIGLLMVRN